MTIKDIIRQRLFNQQISKTNLETAAQLVSHLGAMQAQEFGMAKWAIGLRLKKLRDSEVEKAFNQGSILRTHVLRPTWHFVTPEAIRWMIALTAPGIQAKSAYMHKQSELDSRIFNKSNDVIIKSLEGGKFMTRTALQEELSRARINAKGFRLGYIMMHAELTGTICSGPRQGKQFTYGLLDERVATTKSPDREESLARLALIYFTSRGPSTVHDFATWSGLPVKEARNGATALPNEFEKELVDGQEYIFLPQAAVPQLSTNSTFLMPDYDEYGMGYKDRSAMHDPLLNPGINRANPIFNRMMVVNGKIAGTWRRIDKGKNIEVKITLFTALSKSNNAAIQKAVARYKRFMKG